MKQEVRQIRPQAVVPERIDGPSLSERINKRFKGLNVDGLPIPARKTTRVQQAMSMGFSSQQ